MWNIIANSTSFSGIISTIGGNRGERQFAYNVAMYPPNLILDTEKDDESAKRERSMLTMLRTTSVQTLRRRTDQTSTIIILLINTKVASSRDVLLTWIGAVG